MPAWQDGHRSTHAFMCLGLWAPGTFSPQLRAELWEELASGSEVDFDHFLAALRGKRVVPWLSEPGPSV